MRSRLIWITSGLLSGVLAAPVGWGADGASAKPKANRGLSQAEAKEVLRDLRELAEAVRKDSDSTSAAGGLKNVERPERTVRAPKLTAEDLDRMLAKHLEAEKVKPAGTADDEEFARRVWLDLTGTLPTPEEVEAFATDSNPKKRAALVDRLLKDESFGRNWARYWRDAISYRATVANPRLVDFDSLENWMTEQFNANRPWDEMVREIIDGTGDTSQNGAVVFTAAHMAQPVEVAGEVSRLFMGVQIQCAQCHDHPTDPWKREQFHEFASFFAGTQARRNAKTAKGATGLTVSTRNGKPRYTMPDLKDPKKSTAIEPKFFFAVEDTIPGTLSAQDRRALAASYVTGQDNPYFARAFVNRVWAVLVGTPFYSPVDDMGPTREGQATEVLDRLASEWAAGGYDVKWLMRTILNTQTYARQARASTSEAGGVPFASATPTQLRADQVVDSLEKALGLPLDGQVRKGAKKGGNQAAAIRGRNTPRRLLNVVFGADPSIPTDEVMGTIPQALFLMNSPQVNRALEARPQSVLGEILSENKSDTKAVEALYLRVLSRTPTDAERKTCSEYIAKVGDREEAFEDLLWALINSAEFISRR